VGLSGILRDGGVGMGLLVMMMGMARIGWISMGEKEVAVHRY